ncbi:LLM class flavin-dependent oxidoreductase [Bauldia litoralis]|uniref:Luciferase-like monooxygenase n=1 Tax=Bauldia litoralis TaxID=665467 RepID=A0A1G6B5H1_9HYPH|nr:LLM class flavin-dependent oxidoreductase [Bauldia litoralis]SDB15907.1 Luciferase-like monooxygenase [Bauldia litoralis]
MEIGRYRFGEDRRLDIAIASPAIMMAAVDAVTKRIQVTGAVTILSTLDPVRLSRTLQKLAPRVSGRRRGTSARAR